MAVFQGQSQFTQIKFLAYDLRNFGSSFKENSFVPFLSPFQCYFGINAIQDANYLTIAKTDLKITPEINNTGESLLVAIFLHSLNNLYQNQGNVSIEFWRQTYITSPRNTKLSILLIKLYVLVAYQITQLVIQPTINAKDF